MVAEQLGISGVETMLLCRTCNGQIICDHDTGEEFCVDCGTVARDNIEISSVRRAFSFDDLHKRSGTGEPTSLMLGNMGLSTFINDKNIDANGKQIQGYLEIERLRRLNKITVSNSSKTKNLNRAMRDIRRITEILGIGNPVAERAAYIYRKALDRGLIKGRSINGIVAAAIYIACKDAGNPRSIDELQAVIGKADRKNIAYYYKFLLRELKIRVPLPVPSNSISRISGKARLTEKTARKALELLGAVADNAMLSGKNPVSLAAAALYLATLETKEYTTQLRIAIAADVSTVTVRKRCLEIIQLVRETRPDLLASLDNLDKQLPSTHGQDSNRSSDQDTTAKSTRGLFLSNGDQEDLLRPLI